MRRVARSRRPVRERCIEETEGPQRRASGDGTQSIHDLGRLSGLIGNAATVRFVDAHRQATRATEIDGAGEPPVRTSVQNLVQRNGKKGKTLGAPVKSGGGAGSKKKKTREKREAQAESDFAAVIDRALTQYGHAPDRHVGRSQADLQNRLFGRGRIDIASTFTTDADLRAAVHDLLSAHEAKVKTWFEGEEPQLALEGDLPGGCGVSALGIRALEPWEERQDAPPNRLARVVDMSNRLDGVFLLLDREHPNYYDADADWLGFRTCYPMIRSDQ